MKKLYTIEGNQYNVTLLNDVVTINNKATNHKLAQISTKLFTIWIGHKTFRVEILKQEGTNQIIKVNNSVFNVQSTNPLDDVLIKMGFAGAEESHIKEILAPMPGTVLKVMVSPGQDVKKGEPLLILEAMKMENIIKSPSDATVKGVLVASGQTVEKGLKLLEF